MEAKLSTFGDFIETANPIAEPVKEEKVETTGNESGEVKVPDLEPKEESKQEVKDDKKPDPVVAKKDEEKEENVSTLEVPDFDEKEVVNDEQKQVESKKEQPQDWKQAIKAVDKKDILKELGVDDFVIELNEYIVNGGQAADYLAAKSRNWNDVSDLDIMRDEFKARYPNLSAEEIERKITRKYMLEELDDDLKEDGLIDLKSDAYELRQKRIEKDGKLIIPQRPQPENNEAKKAEQDKIAAEQYKAAMEFFENHEATKNLMQSKRVAIDLGDNGKFNFNIDKPEQLMRVVTDGKVWGKVINNDKGEPDVAKLQKIALYAINPTKFENDLVSYGKSLGHFKEVEEGQNAKKPGGKAAQPDEKPTYRVGTYGSRN